MHFEMISMPFHQVDGIYWIPGTFLKNNENHEKLMSLKMIKTNFNDVQEPLEIHKNDFQCISMIFNYLKNHIFIIFDICRLDDHLEESASHPIPL